MGTSHPRVIDVFGVLKKSVSEWNTLLFGKSIMESMIQENFKFTTKTKISSIIELEILNYLTHLLIKDYTVDVNLLKEFGINHVENVEKLSLLTNTTSELMVSVLGANNVVLKMQLKINVKENSNTHNTVKPLSLMRYLCRLVTPAKGMILDPFFGSGTTGCAAKIEGFSCIGIDDEQEHLDITKARIKAWEEEKLNTE